MKLSLRSLRQAHGFTLAQVAFYCGYSPATLKRWESLPVPPAHALGHYQKACKHQRIIVSGRAAK